MQFGQSLPSLMHSEFLKRPATLVLPFDGLVDGLSDAIALVANDGRLLYVNRAAAALLGRGASIGVDVLESIELPGNVRARILRALRRCIAGKEGRAFVATVDIAGSKRHLSIRTTAARAEFATACDAAWVIATDVTDHVETARQRDALYDQLQAAGPNAGAASEARDRFLAIVSHDLRSPLNGIQSWSHVLESRLDGADRVDQVTARALAGIRAGIDQQVKLLEDLLHAASR